MPTQPIEDFVEEHALNRQTGGYALPEFPKLDPGISRLVLQISTGIRAFQYLLSAAWLPNEGTKAAAVESWTYLRDLWAEHLAKLPPGEQLYVQVVFIRCVYRRPGNACSLPIAHTQRHDRSLALPRSQSTKHCHVPEPAVIRTTNTPPTNLLLQCLMGDGSTPLAALKMWMADNPGAAEGTVHLREHHSRREVWEHRSALYTLLDCTEWIMLQSLDREVTREPKNRRKPDPTARVLGSWKRVEGW